MPDPSTKSPVAPSDPTTQRAIAEIVKMNPRKVTVTLTLPVPSAPDRPMVELEWTREDTNMPLSELLALIEQYVAHFGAK